LLHHFEPITKANPEQTSDVSFSDKERGRTHFVSDVILFCRSSKKRVKLNNSRTEQQGTKITYSCSQIKPTY